MRPNLVRLGDAATRLPAGSGQSRGRSFPGRIAISVAIGTVLAPLFPASAASAAQAAAPGSGPFAVMAAQLVGPPGSFETLAELALLVGMVAILLMSWRTQRMAAVAISAAQGGSATERWREAVALLGRVGDDGSPTIEARSAPSTR